VKLVYGLRSQHSIAPITTGLIMLHWLTTPIFFLTPYIALWSVLNGLIAIALLHLLKLKPTRMAQLATVVTTAIASMLWNWSIEFSQATFHLNVDHPYLRISWADALNGVCVFGLNALVLGFWVMPQSRAAIVVKIAGIAALVTILTDTFFF
jgi:hypothetical protein